jgi:hypothetical protein
MCVPSMSLYSSTDKYLPLALLDLLSARTERNPQQTTPSSRTRIKTKM